MFCLAYRYDTYPAFLQCHIQKTGVKFPMIFEPNNVHPS